MEGLAVGRIVHCCESDEFQHHAAIVSQVVDKEKGIVNLMVFRTDVLALAMGKQAFPCLNVPYSETKEPGTWHWIEKA